MRRKAYVMAAGALALAAALTLAAYVAPNRAAAAAHRYRPAHSAIVARVAPRDAREVAERQALLASPDDVSLAVDLARAEIARARALSDPRHLGRAQALLGRWWSLAAPPPDVLLLRATIRQSLHEFDAARADLDALIAVRPDDTQAHLTRAVVATVRADYAAARESCTHLEGLLAATCKAPLDALAGDVDGAYSRLAAALDRRSPAYTWALTTLAELAIQRGQDDKAVLHLSRVLEIDPRDTYARAALADVSTPADATALLAGFEDIDTLLVRLAIAGDRDAQRRMRERIAAAAMRGDRVHLREEAMFVLAVESDAPRALRVARENWEQQKELADARLLVEAAVEGREPSAAKPVVEWVRANGVKDVRLARLLARLGGAQ